MRITAKAQQLARHLQRPDGPGQARPTGKNSYGRDNTFGGYSTKVVVPEGGSLIGSISETQAVLDFCAEHNIGPDIRLSK